MSASIPRLNSGVRLKHDKVRAINVLLGPERALMLDDIGQTIMDEVDGKRSINEISAGLAQKFSAPVEMIESDVNEFLAKLAASRYVIFHDGSIG